MKNPVGMHSCYWSGTSIENDLNNIIAYTAKIAPDSIELNLSSFLEMSKIQRSELRKRIESTGMTVSVNGGLMSPEKNLCSSDSSVRNAGLAHCRRVAEACRDIGAPTWSGIMHGVWGSRPDAMNDTENEKRCCYSMAVQSLKEAVSYAAECGVVYCLEVVNRYELYFLNTASEGVAFCEEVNSSNCKLLLDLFHMSIEEDNVADAIRNTQAKNQLGCIHIGETNRRIPTGGASNIDWQAFGDAVRESGYTGSLVLEPFEFSTGENASKVCLWRNLDNPNDLDAIVQKGMKGVSFIKSLV